jgi:hypothetical protein
MSASSSEQSECAWRRSLRFLSKDEITLDHRVSYAVGTVISVLSGTGQPQHRLTGKLIQ